MRYINLFLFYAILSKLPGPTAPLIGPFLEFLRYRCCKGIFKKCGEKVNVGTNARFGNGFDIEIGDYSGIGRDCKVPSNTKIGNFVMMGPNVTIHSANHKYDNLEIPMLQQGVIKYGSTIIEDDVWIGSHAIILPGLVIRKGSIIGTGSVVTKSFPEYSIIAGNPAKIIGSRLKNNA